MAQEGSFGNLRTKILAAKFGDNVQEVLFGTEALLFQQLHKGGNLPHVGNRGFFVGHGVALGVVVAHSMLSKATCSRCWTSCSIRLCV